MNDEESPSLGLQAAEAALELVAVGHDRRGVIAVGVVDRGQVHIEAVAPQTARLIDAGPVEQAMQPCVKARWAAKGWQVTPGPDERLLDGVLGLIGVAEDEPGGGVQAED